MIAVVEQSPTFAGFPVEILFGLIVGIGGLVFAAVLAILKWNPTLIQPSLDVSSLAAQNEKLSNEISELRGQNTILWQQWRASERDFATESAKREGAETRAKESDAKVMLLEQRVTSLVRELEMTNVIKPKPEKRELNVLGIWTEGEDLDPKANALALKEAGVQYTALIGNRATKEQLFYELRRNPDITAIEIGALGDQDGTLLADGKAGGPWWANLANTFNLELFLFLSNHSGGTAKLSLGDQVFRASNVRAVITVQGEIPDEVARTFARAFYTCFADGLGYRAAFNQAKIPIADEYADLFVLREKPEKATSGD